ncbi:hypothetical protein HF521_001349 [Silurus meridionalis]|uniref:Uncharacterized protein n=1 Tax=Silurus meridionalis TaxID=175797 RepID=A0A8T0B5U7_SILME|nr:hypothetical protein HF521_001349 [Silurus meridionalis]
MAGSLPLLSVRPIRCMVDERFEVRVQDLQPGFRVTLHALLQSEDGDFWEAFGHYVSDETGHVTVSKDPSLGGSYEGVEPMGLLWSMKPIPGSRTGLRFRKTDVYTPMDVHISVYEDHLTEGFREKPPIALAVTQRWYTAPGIQRVNVTDKGLEAAIYIPPGPGPFPAVLDLWGGGGGLVEYRSALLASRGYVALALEYIGRVDADGNSYKVDKNYFEAAFTVLKEHPQVSPERIAILGLSFGVSVTLGMVVYSSVIKMGRIKCPILLIVGEDDQNWPASESAEDMKLMMEHGGNRHLLTVLSYPGAGHLIEPPYSPHCRASNFMLTQHEVRTKVVVLWGGQTEPHSRAQEDSWHKTLAFLEQHLFSIND